MILLMLSSRTKLGMSNPSNANWNSHLLSYTSVYTDQQCMSLFRTECYWYSFITQYLSLRYIKKITVPVITLISGKVVGEGAGIFVEPRFEQKILI